MTSCERHVMLREETDVFISSPHNLMHFLIKLLQSVKNYSVILLNKCRDVSIVYTSFLCPNPQTAICFPSMSSLSRSFCHHSPHVPSRLLRFRFTHTFITPSGSFSSSSAASQILHPTTFQRPCLLACWFPTCLALRPCLCSLCARSHRLRRTYAAEFPCSWRYICRCCHHHKITDLLSHLISTLLFHFDNTNL